MAYTAQADADTVAKLLLDSDIQPNTRQLLVDGLPHAISAKGGPRHPLQEQFVTLARQTLQELKSSAAEKVAGLKDAAEAARAHVEGGRTAQEAAEKGEEAAQAGVRKAMEALEERQAAVARTTNELATAARGRDRLLKAWSKLEGLKSEVSFLIEGPFCMLRDGGWGDDESRDSAAAEVVKRLAKKGAEPSLVAAAKEALPCKPEARSEFDKQTIGIVAEVLQAEATSVDEQMQAKQLDKENAEAEALGLEALLSREVEQESAAQTKVFDAKALLQDSTDTRKEAAAELKRREEAVGEQLAAETLAVQRVELVEAALAAAERLVAFDYDSAMGEAAEPGC